jgi:mannonate dehydratase
MTQRMQLKETIPVIQLAEFFPPEPNALWHLAKQVGVTHAITSLPPAENGSKPWDYLNLLHLKTRFESFGFELAGIESAPPQNRIKLGREGRDEEIAVIAQFIENMGALHIPMWCYNDMAEFNWLRTHTATPSRGGALVTAYDHSLMANAPLTDAGIVEEEVLWQSLEYFLQRIVPIAEKAQVKLALHPDDPPISPIRGVARILRSADALERAINLVPSPFSGITLCQGTLATAGEDIPATVRRFSNSDKIFFVHFRDIQGTAERFQEAFHDEGKTDMFAAMKAYIAAGYEGPMRPDHVPTLYGEDNRHPGYETLGKLFAIGYIKGLMEAAQKSQTPGSGFR